jgi:hypothetical protein
VQHCAATLGTAGFGEVRFPDGHGGRSPTPVEVLHHFWPQWVADLELFAPTPEEQSELMTVGVRMAMELTKDVLAPRDALTIAMEAAIPMSRVEF